VRSLMVSIFLYSNVVYFPSLTGAEFRRLELAFNACARYVYTIFGVLIIFLSFQGGFKGLHCPNIWNIDWLVLFIR
jgi:hypothetical protein